jgi:hypothetical protein
MKDFRRKERQEFEGAKEEFLSFPLPLCVKVF